MRAEIAVIAVSVVVMAWLGLRFDQWAPLLAGWLAP